MTFVGRRFQSADLLPGCAHPFGKLLDVLIVPIMSPLVKGIFMPLWPLYGPFQKVLISGEISQSLEILLSYVGVGGFVTDFYPAP